MGVGNWLCEAEMKREDIAWDNLSDIQKAQMIHFYPELAEDKHKDKKGGKTE